VTHTFLTAGTYNVTLTVTDDLGLTHSTTKQVVVTANTAPIAQFTTTQTGLTVNVDATQSRDELRIASYSWNWGDGTASNTGLTQTHTYLVGGNYMITLTVTDPEGLVGTSTQTINVSPPNLAPIARYNFTTSGLSISVDGRSSSDDNGITSYQWNWGDNTEFGIRSTGTHDYAVAGTYTVVLTVGDAQSVMNSTSQQITVPATNNPPTAFFSSSMIGLMLTVNAAVSQDDKGIVSYRWDWGDTTTDTETVSTKTHIYTAAGTYTVTLTVSDLEGATATATARVKTNNR
jgi:PKD repeat protein